MTIIMFHYVRPNKSKNLSFLKKFSIEKFKLFLDKYNKFDFYKRSDFHNFKENIPFDKKILLTFDDGLSDHYDYIFPELKARNILVYFLFLLFLFRKEYIIISA